MVMDYCPVAKACYRESMLPAVKQGFCLLNTRLSKSLDVNLANISGNR
jgi:hypothetical protein